MTTSSIRSFGPLQAHAHPHQPSVRPISSRSASGMERWVVVQGWVIRLLASPRLLEMSTICSASRNRNAAAWPPEIEGHHVAAAGHLVGDDRRLRMVGAAADRSAGSTFAWAAMHVGDLAGVLGLRCTRSSSVSSPFSSTQALNGDSAGPVWRIRL